MFLPSVSLPPVSVRTAGAASLSHQSHKRPNAVLTPPTPPHYWCRVGWWVSRVSPTATSLGSWLREDENPISFSLGFFRSLGEDSSSNFSIETEIFLTVASTRWRVPLLSFRTPGLQRGFFKLFLVLLPDLQPKKGVDHHSPFPVYWSMRKPFLLSPPSAL